MSVASLVLFASHAEAQELAPSTATEALDVQRERFRAGLERYRAGAFADAILIWESVYRELGRERGYRVAFDLARAYEKFGDSTRAAESYEAYVKEVARRREAGETLETVVEKQEVDAKARLAELAATQGRIRIGGDRAVVVKIDGGAERLAPRPGFVAYVTPSKTHVVTFDPGTKDEEQVSVRVELGEVVAISPPPPRLRPSPGVIEPREASPHFEVRRERPYDKTVFIVAAGVTAVSVIVPVVLYANANSVRSDYDAARVRAGASRDLATYDDARVAADRSRNDYDGARNAAHASLAIPVALGAITLGLTAYWLFGAKETRVPMSASVSRDGAMLGVSGSFL